MSDYSDDDDDHDFCVMCYSGDPSRCPLHGSNPDLKTGVRYSLRCKECSKMCKDSDALGRHARTHAEGLHFECKMCPKKFSTSGGLARHLRGHAAAAKGRYDCPKCIRSYPSKERLAMHVFTHAPAPPPE